MHKIAILFAILVSAQAQLTSNGACNFSSIIHTQEVPLNKLITVFENYYEIKRISNNWNTGHCTSLDASMDATSGKVSLTLREVVNEKLIIRNTTFTYPGTEVQYLNVAFEDFNSNFTYLALNARYAVFYACSDVGQRKQEYAWVLGANTTLTDSEKKIIDTSIKNNNLNNATWVQTSHSAEACKSGATNNIKISPIFVLIFGFLVSKGL